MPLNYPSKPWTDGMTFLNGTVEYIYNEANNMWTFGAVGKGDPGVSGLPGAVYTPTINASGLIQWSNDGGLVNPDPVNIRGPVGASGLPGTPGSDAVVSSVLSSFMASSLLSGVLTLSHNFGSVSMFGGLVDNGRNVVLDDHLIVCSTNQIDIDLSQYNVTGIWQAFFTR